MEEGRRKEGEGWPIESGNDSINAGDTRPLAARVRFFTAPGRILPFPLTRDR